MANSHTPQVSIVMPLYNKEADVRDAICSILAQEFTDFELIIVNDGSTDKSPDIIREFKDNRIKIFDQENSGVSAARNSGIKKSKSNLIAFLDADDYWRPLFLSTILKLKLKFPECSVFATSYSYLFEDGRETEPIINGLPTKPWIGILPDYFHVASISDPPICSSAIAVTREAIDSIDGFPVDIKIGEDLLTWAKLAAHYKIAFSTSPLAVFRQISVSHAPPTRIPNSYDQVGLSLKKLLENVDPSHHKMLKKYIAWWYKNRANMYLRSGMKLNSLYEICKMGSYHLNMKFYLYCICLLLPTSLIRKLISLQKYKTKG